MPPPLATAAARSSDQCARRMCADASPAATCSPGSHSCLALLLVREEVDFAPVQGVCVPLARRNVADCRTSVDGHQAHVLADFVAGAERAGVAPDVRHGA